MSHNVFQNNFAGNEGGCIKYTKVVPNFESNIFKDNFAYYGNHVAGFVSKALILNITSYDDWMKKYAGDEIKLYIDNFCNYSNNGTDCIRNDSSHLDLKENSDYISNFTVNIKQNQTFQGKILVLLLDAHGQIVTTQNALGQFDRNQTQNLYFRENAYFLDNNLERQNNLLLRLQVYTSIIGIIIIDNFKLNNKPGLYLYIFLNYFYFKNLGTNIAVVLYIKQDWKEINSTSKTQDVYMKIWIPMKVSPCQMGTEYFNITLNKCVGCPPGNFSGNL